jgi:hypothetical protein
LGIDTSLAGRALCQPGASPSHTLAKPGQNVPLALERCFSCHSSPETPIIQGQNWLNCSANGSSTDGPPSIKSPPSRWSRHCQANACANAPAPELPLGFVCRLNAGSRSRAEPILEIH